MNWRRSLILLFTSFTFCHDFARAQSAATASVLTSSLVVPSNPPTALPSRNILASGVKGNGEDENNDGDDGDDGEDPSDDTDADSDSDTNQVDAATSSSRSSSTAASSSSVAHSTNNKPQDAPTHQAATHSHSHTTHSFPAQSTHFSFRPHPVPTSSFDGTTPVSVSSSSSSSSHHQPPVAIAFEVIGALVLFGLILCCARCMYKYRRTPARDRVALILDRHRLERELEEMEEAQPYRRRTSLTRPPPPAYQNAPAYDEAISDDGRTPTTQASERSEHEEQPHQPP